MKKKLLVSIMLILAIVLNINGCSSGIEEKDNSITQEESSISENKDNGDISIDLEKQIKEDIDLVLSYTNGYDDTMKKHISEDNFYVCNYVEFYSLYIGELNLEIDDKKLKIEDINNKINLLEEDKKYQTESEIEATENTISSSQTSIVSLENQIIKNENSIKELEEKINKLEEKKQDYK